MMRASGLAGDIERDALAAALSIVVRATIRGDVKENLIGKVVLTITGTGGELRACDYRIDVRAAMPVTGAAPGAILIDGDRLRTFVGKVRKGGILSLSVGTELMRVPVADKNGKVTYPERLCDVLKIRSGRTNASLLAEDYVAYPSREPVPAEIEPIVMSGQALAAAIRTVQPAMLRDTKDSREHFMGVHLAPVVGHLQAVASDTKRLHLTICEAQIPDAAPSATLPVDAIETLALIAEAAGNETVRLSITRQDATLRFAGVTCTTPLIVIPYPALERVFPEIGTVVTVMAADLRQTIDRVGTVVADPKKGIRIRVEPEAGRLIVASRADLSAQATAEEWIDVQATGPAEGIFNHKFMLAALEQFGDSPVALRFAADADLAMTITDSPEAAERRFLVIPTR